MSRFTSSHLAVAVAVAVTCGLACTGAQLSLHPEPFTLGEGRFLLQVSDERIVLARDGSALVTLDPSSFQIGLATGGANADRSWDPWEIEQRGEAPSGIQFRSPVAWSPVSTSPGFDAVIDLDYGDGIGARVALALASSSRFTLTLAPSSPAPGQPPIVLARLRVHTSGDPGEGLYGMGEQVDSVDNRGKLRPMQLEVDGQVESGTNDAHAPVPLLIGTRGWGMFVASPRVGVFDVLRKDPRIVEATFAVAPLGSVAGADSLRMDLFASEAPLDLYREYYAASGLPQPPPPWSLGPWVSRAASKGQAEVLGDLAKLKELHLATSGMSIERPFARGVNTFDFDPALFPDPAGMIERAHASGVRLALWSTPYLAPAAEPLVSEAQAKGFFPRTIGPKRNDWSAPLDFTSPQAAAFWRGLVRRYTSAGVDGFKLDYGEDVVPSIGATRSEWKFADGSDERTMHHRFSGLYHRVYADAVSGREPGGPAPLNPLLPFMLVRAAHWGEQALGVIVSAGESDATFTRYKEPVGPAGGTLAGVGGLPTAVVMGLSLSASGFPYFASEAGGRRHGPADKELFIRWVEQSALSTVMAVGDGGGAPPWASVAEGGRDDESLATYRTYASLHLQLFPYAWTYAQRLLHDGRPIQRPVGLVYPEIARHPDDEYLLGDELLVAPVLARGQTRRRLALPPGTWVDFWDATPFTADAHGEIEVDAPLGKVPLFLRDGAIVPMFGPSVQSFAGDPGPLWALIAPGQPRAFELWDGSLVARTSADTFDVKGGPAFARGFVLQLIAQREPAAVLRDQANLTRLPALDALEAAVSGWTWTSERRGTLYVKVPPGAARVVVR